MPPVIQLNLWNILVFQHKMRGHHQLSYFPQPSFSPATLKLQTAHFFPYLWVCSWSNRGQKIQHCKHSTRVNNDCIRALYGRGSCLEFHISYVFLRANRRCWNRMICVPAGQKTSHGYNTQLLWALHFSNSCRIVLTYRCYSLFLSLPSDRTSVSLLKPVGHVSLKTAWRGFSFSTILELGSVFPRCYMVWRT